MGGCYYSGSGKVRTALWNTLCYSYTRAIKKKNSGGVIAQASTLGNVLTQWPMFWAFGISSMHTHVPEGTQRI